MTRKVWFALLMVGYFFVIYRFLAQVQQDGSLYVIIPFLIVAGALNFATDNPGKKKNILNVQLFVTWCFVLRYAGILYSSFRFWIPSSLLTNGPTFIGLILVFISLLKLKQLENREH
jgi:hypothetical protein